MSAYYKKDPQFVLIIGLVTRWPNNWFIDLRQQKWSKSQTHTQCFVMRKDLSYNFRNLDAIWVSDCPQSNQTTKVKAQSSKAVVYNIHVLCQKNQTGTSRRKGVEKKHNMRKKQKHLLRLLDTYRYASKIAKFCVF